MNPDYIVWYCKANKKTGNTIMVKDLKTGIVESMGELDMGNVSIRMAHNNSQKEAKRSGATTVLEVYKNE